MKARHSNAMVPLLFIPFLPLLFASPFSLLFIFCYICLHSVWGFGFQQPLFLRILVLWHVFILSCLFSLVLFVSLWNYVLVMFSLCPCWSCCVLSVGPTERHSRRLASLSGTISTQKAQVVEGARLNTQRTVAVWTVKTMYAQRITKTQSVASNQTGLYWCRVIYATTCYNILQNKAMTKHTPVCSENQAVGHFARTPFRILQTWGKEPCAESLDTSTHVLSSPGRPCWHLRKPTWEFREKDLVIVQCTMQNAFSQEIMLGKSFTVNQQNNDTRDALQVCQDARYARCA